MHTGCADASACSNMHRMPEEETSQSPVPVPETPASPEPATVPIIEPVPEPVAEPPIPETPPVAPEKSPSPKSEIEIPLDASLHEASGERSAPQNVVAEQPESQAGQTNPPSVSQPQTVSAPTPHSVNDLLLKARATIQARKRKKLDWIMEFVSKNSSITNDMVQEHFRVGDTTATRYLAVLVKEGKLRRVGTTGKAVRYERL